MKYLVLLFVISFLFGCVKTTGIKVTTPGYNINQNLYVKKLPTENIFIKVNVGNSIISSYTVNEQSAIELTKKEKHTGLFNGFENKYTLKGIYPIYSKGINGIIYAKKGGLRQVVNASSTDQFIFGGLYVPYDNKQNHSFFLRNPIPTLEPLKRQVKFNTTTVTKTFLNEQGFKKELLYSGKNGNSILIEYREFKNNIARPAFSQTLTYDISNDKIIGFKGALFEIKKATNTYIEIKVIKHLK